MSKAIVAEHLRVLGIIFVGLILVLISILEAKYPNDDEVIRQVFQVTIPALIVLAAIITVLEVLE